MKVQNIIIFLIIIGLPFVIVGLSTLPMIDSESQRDLLMTPLLIPFLIVLIFLFHKKNSEVIY